MDFASDQDPGIRPSKQAYSIALRCFLLNGCNVLYGKSNADKVG